MESNYTDEQLIELVHENSEEAKSVLYERNKFKIEYFLKKYSIAAKSLGIDLKDLKQEAMVAFTDAILNYNPSKDASLTTFICLCVERRIKKCCIKAGRIKNQAMKDTLSLEYNYEDSDATLKELIEDEGSDPLIKMTEEEQYIELVTNIKNSLTNFESEVYELLTSGMNYRDIAVILDKEPKQIDNTIQRIKIKIRKILSNRKN